MKRVVFPFLFLLTLLTATLSHAAETWSPDVWQKMPSDEFPLWSKGAPGARGKNPADIPTLTPFFAPPTNTTGASIIICPGGAYGKLSAHEGVYYAMWLNEQGITAFVLKYRLGTDGYRHPAMMNDAQRAIRYVRSKAKEWNLDPNRIGILGSSAGGHLASTCLTHFDAGQPKARDPIDRASSRPDLGILCYPVITLGKHTHRDTRKNLLGSEPNRELLELLSTEKQVRPDTPPTFIFHTEDDAIVSVENARLFAAALKQHRVPFELHLYPSGPHGIGLGSRQWDPLHRHPWTGKCKVWLKKHGFSR
ncbi:MAG: alpha/beta hydrolase [Luteolibacter sp.]